MTITSWSFGEKAGKIELIFSQNLPFIYPHCVVGKFGYLSIFKNNGTSPWYFISKPRCLKSCHNTSTVASAVGFLH